MSQNDLKMDMDQTDNAQPFRHEIKISVGGDTDDIISVKTPANLTPTPSPRSLQSSQGADEISASSTDDDNAILTPAHKSSDNVSGVDNPAFENEHRTSQQLRSLTSFGQNGTLQTVNGKEQTNSNGLDKPLAGKLTIFLFSFFAFLY